MTKYSSILEPVQYRVKTGEHVLSNRSFLEITDSSGGEIRMKFCTDFGTPWAMTQKDVAELIEVLTAIHDAMDD